ncbi:MAG: serine hydrolase [Desulfobacteraceae bacterium]|nr:serine hydrolase [Desulfobacteraceae bacterium]
MNVQPTNDKVDSIFERYTEPGSPGCALAVMKDGEIVYQQGYGLANLEHNVPILPSTVFNIGSMAKQFTAFAIALLEDEGKLSYNDDFRKYLPEMHDFGQTITIRHLIHHTSGLRGSFPELLALAEWRDTDATTTEDVYWLLKAQRELNLRPGDEFLYVNSNYVLLALICEQVSGQSFATFCHERMFGPLGMTRSVVNDSFVKLIPGRALGYYDDEQGNWFNAPLTNSVIGPTNVYTTVEDLVKWDENCYTGEIGGRAVIERIDQPGWLNDGTELDYAFGLMVGPAHQHWGWQVIEHGGGQGGYGSWMVRFPELHLSVVVLFNHFLWEMQDYALKVADLFLEEKAAPKMLVGQQAASEETAAPIELSAEQLEKKSGAYFNALRAALREITYADGQLQFQGLDLVPLSENLFFFEAEPQTRVEFIPTKDDAVAGMKTITSSGEYGYDRVETVSLTPDKLAQYAGCYYSPELDIYWTIEVGDNHLIAKRRKYVDSKLTPLFTDAFGDDWLPLMDYPTTYLVVFERDEHDTITGLCVSGTRVRNLRFIKQAV